MKLLDIEMAEKYTVKEFGSNLQKLREDKILSISWSTGDESESKPMFHYFRDIDEAIVMLDKLYVAPFILGETDTDRYTKENSIVFLMMTNLRLK